MPLRLPDGADRLSLDRNTRPVAYIPFGFVPFRNWQLGNGDYFGLYWPIGREAQAPIVAETVHDDGSVMPAFSSLDTFLAVTQELDEADHPDWPTLEQDGASPLALYEEARRLLKAQQVEAAIGRLETAIAGLPEYTNALALLATQYLRLGQTDAACRMAVRAAIAPLSFGFDAPVGRMRHWLAQQEHAPDDVRDDPVWLNRHILVALPSGGAKENDAYPVLRDMIEAYAACGEIIQALTLMQSYAEYMTAETVSFRERHGFSREAHRAQEVELSQRLPDGPRLLA